MKLNILIFLITMVILYGCNGRCKLDTTNENHRGWELTYRNDGTGKSLFGNKEDLIDAIRKGYPVRIGFGGRRANDTTKSVEHIVDVHFLTIANSKEVFGQIHPIIGQNPQLEKDTLSITFRENIEWTIMVGTNGFSDRLTTDRLNDTVLSHRSRPIDVSWFVYYSGNDNNIKASPMWKKNN